MGAAERMLEVPVAGTVGDEHTSFDERWHPRGLENKNLGGSAGLEKGRWGRWEEYPTTAELRAQDSEPAQPLNSSLLLHLGKDVIVQ